MKNTAIERYECGNGDGMIEDNEGFYMSHYDHLKAINELEAKHEEKLKQAVIKTYLDNEDYCDDLIEEEAELYYEANFNTKETITLCCCTHQQACEVCGNEKGLDSDFWNSIR
jgi:hypothetical protein